MLNVDHKNALIGKPWRECLAVDAFSAAVLDAAIDANSSLSLPPLLIANSSEQPCVVGGLVRPLESLAESALCRVIFWPLPVSISEERLLATIEPADTLAVLGVEPNANLEDLSSTLHSVRRHLIDLLRPQDLVSEPSSHALAILIRGADEGKAADICRAVLSHLHRSDAELGKRRIAVGLAHCAGEEGSIHTLLTANRAMSHALLASGVEPILAGSALDKAFVINLMLGANGLLGRRPTLNDSSDLANHELSLAEPIGEPRLAPIESDIEGYVVDNMEGAVDQAIFLAKLDVPVSIIGAAGTGKLYVARVIHEETGAPAERLHQVDCREFRSRRSALAGLAQALESSDGKTLVFKSPHLMHIEAQNKLARQISSRTLADVTPAKYLPAAKLIALFPDTLEELVRKGMLSPQLASAFGAYPILVPPIRDRKQAVLRWAHKILVQEGALRDRSMKGFTPDAERAMLLYDWPGNISEMRQCINDALANTDKDWLTPVDLGLFKGISADGVVTETPSDAYLSIVDAPQDAQDVYQPSAEESLDLALSQALHDMLEFNLTKPLGAWLQDDLVLAALDRYRNNLPRAAEFLHTSARNLRRWESKIEARGAARNGSALWQEPRRLLREWVREASLSDISPLLYMQEKLLRHLQQQGGALTAAKCAEILDVSTPTYQKRLRELAVV